MGLGLGASLSYVRRGEAIIFDARWALHDALVKGFRGQNTGNYGFGTLAQWRKSTANMAAQRK